MFFFELLIQSVSQRQCALMSARASLRIKLIRLACDNSLQENAVQKAILMLSRQGISRRRILVYALFNYTDTPNDFLDRTRFLLKNGVVVYPMRYEPLTVLKKNEFISPNWSRQLLDGIQQARRVIGYAGSFPPYKPLIEKLSATNDFENAFALRPSLEQIRSGLSLNDQDPKIIYAFYKNNNLSIKQLSLDKALDIFRNRGMQRIAPTIQPSKRKQRRLSGPADWR